MSQRSKGECGIDAEVAFEQSMDGQAALTNSCLPLYRYLSLSDSQRATVPIIAVNATIFLMWRAQALMWPLRQMLWNNFMHRHFVHTPASGRSYTQLTCTFSHQSLVHFGFNNYALWTCGAAAFSTAAFYAQGGDTRHTADATVIPHFLAFFVTAGVFSGLASHLVRAVRWRAAAQLAGLDVARRNIGRVGGLGASGAVYACFAMAASAFPDSRLS